jgi:hypothetical protein
MLKPVALDRGWIHMQSRPAFLEYVLWKNHKEKSGKSSGNSEWQGQVRVKLGNIQNDMEKSAISSGILQNDKEKSVKSSGILQNDKEKSVKSSGMLQNDKEKSVNISGILQIEQNLSVQGYWIYFMEVSVTYYCEPKSQIKSYWLLREFFKQCTPQKQLWPT